ncbi:SDR family NAD(P)-dependent oxidoreductase [Cupriavidus sp. D384]|uniref:SDR family NAD(P)-dependent oxidoreductase n=1 Tax=Cupriavidus sp. D384 TaxID=1538095 RepID=UPI00082A104F|nr:SDR family NAD(P)-dependent oxidoreductase [Cupriavidus sp. D384]
MDLNIKDQTVLLTGAGNGIGEACAHAFANEGCKVVVTDVSAEAAERVAAEINAAGGLALGFQMDVCCKESVRSGVARVEKVWGTIDVLFNNAGFSRDNAVETMTDEQWSTVLDVNLTGQFHCIREVVPGMSRQGFGRIVNMASRAHFGELNKSNYAAAKAGVIGMTKALSLELGPRGITVNAVAPGIIETERVRNLPQFSGMEERALANMPIQRIGRPKEVAAAVLFLSSAHAGFISGETLHISGGRYG